MGNNVLRLFLAAWTVVVPNAPTFLAGRRMGVDVSILAHQAIALEEVCLALQNDDTRPFVAHIKRWAVRVLLWGCSVVFVFDSVSDPVFEPKRAEQKRRRADVQEAIDRLAAGNLTEEDRKRYKKILTRPSPALMHLLYDSRRSAQDRYDRGIRATAVLPQLHGHHRLPGARGIGQMSACSETASSFGCFLFWVARLSASWVQVREKVPKPAGYPQPLKSPEVRHWIHTWSDRVFSSREAPVLLLAAGMRTFIFEKGPG